VKQASAPIRCLACLGTGAGQSVMTGRGIYIEPCHSCNGAGRLNMIVCPECRVLPNRLHHYPLMGNSCLFCQSLICVTSTNHLATTAS
jgi:hypothetical protein